MPIKKNAGKAKDSAFFKKAKNKAEEYLKDSKKLGKLVGDATKKAEKQKNGPLKDVWESLMASFRLIKAYANGTYREIPWESLLLLVAAVAYFLMPIDFIPDFILGLGYLDDAAVFGFVLKSVKSDLDNFIDWEGTSA